MSLFFKTDAGQNAFTVETRVGDYVVEYPLGASEPTAIAVTAPFMQTRANYARPAVNSILSYNGSNAYFIDDEGFSDKTGGVVTWNRTWATVPATWSEPEEYAFTYPGLTGAFPGAAYNVTNIVENGGVVDLYTTLPGLTTTFNVGDPIYCALGYVRNNVKTYHTLMTRVANGGSSNVRVAIDNLFTGSGNFSNVMGIVRLGTIGRTLQATLVVGSRVINDYALTNIESLDTALPIIPAFAPVDSTGTVATILSTGAATFPNTADYHALVINNGELVAESSTRRR